MALTHAHRFGALQAVHPSLHWSDDKSRGLDGMSSRAPRVPLGFALATAGAAPTSTAAVIARLRLKRDEAAAVNAIASMRGVAAMLRRPQAKPSGVVALLDRFPPAAVAAFAATSTDAIARALALRYLDEWRRVRPLLRGNDLIEMGVPAGPQVSRGLQLLRAARLDGMADDPADERVLVARFAKSIRDAGTMTADLKLHDS
jgi:tRNA nucleotidyltransferase (CCA-adding enzyme)